MSVRIGINPLTWSNDDLPELGGDTPLATCLGEARQAGYAGIELGNKFPRDPAVLQPLLARHGLALVSGWYSAGLLARSPAQELEALEPHLALLAACGCSVLVLCDTTGAVHGERTTALSRRPRMPEGDWARFGAALTLVAEHTLRRGVRVAYHHHMGTVVQTEAEIERLMAVTGDAVGLLLDTGHLTYAGGDPARVARRHGARIAHVHCKDVRPQVLAEVGDAPFLDAVLAGVFTVPGDGGVDYPAVLHALPHYSGWLVVEAEQDPARAHPLTYARLGYGNLVRFARDAGLT